MTKGRNPKPSSVKAAEGNRSGQARSTIKVDPVMKGRPVAPKRMSAEARRIWAEIVSSMPDGLVARVDTGILERYCVAYERWAEINYEIDRQGFEVSRWVRETKAKDAPMVEIRTRNPLFGPLGQMAKEMHITGGECGLSPVARARLATLPQSTGDDPMSMLLGGIGEPEEPWSGASKTAQ